MDESMYPHRQEADEAALRELFSEILRDPDQHLLLAEADGRAVGTAHVMVLRHFGRHLSRSAVVEGVAVDRAYRRKGVGAALMRGVARVARGHGCYKLALSSNVARSGAHRFYSRLGWKRTHYGFSVEVPDEGNG
jgi:GNAT superfamily N-acetyltransferase